MMRLHAIRVALLGGLFLGAAAKCAAQVYTPPPPPLTTLPPCPVDKDAKKRAKRTDCDPTVYPPETVETKGKKAADTAPQSATPASGMAGEKFPFPGEQPAASPSPATKFPYPGEASPDAAQDSAAAAKASGTPAGKAFPYPDGAKPDLPADSVGPAPKPDDSSSSSSSSSSKEDEGAGNAGKAPRSSAGKNPDDDDEDQPRLKDKGSEGKRSKKVIKAQTDAERVDEDLSVAKFYGQSGNYMGAYLRAKDAVMTQPDYPEGHFALGEAAKRLKKKDEAVTEFKAYLKLSPDGEKAKSAEKALDELR